MMPFIQYSIEDIAAPPLKVILSGRGLALVAELVGGFADLLTAPDG